MWLLSSDGDCFAVPLCCNKNYLLCIMSVASIWLGLGLPFIVWLLFVECKLVMAILIVVWLILIFVWKVTNFIVFVSLIFAASVGHIDALLAGRFWFFTVCHKSILIFVCFVHAHTLCDVTIVHFWLIAIIFKAIVIFIFVEFIFIWRCLFVRDKLVFQLFFFSAKHAGLLLEWLECGKHAWGYFIFLKTWVLPIWKCCIGVVLNLVYNRYLISFHLLILFLAVCQWLAYIFFSMRQLQMTVALWQTSLYVFIN